MAEFKLIDDVKVYGLDDSVKASKYPMATDISKCTSEITKTVRNLGSCEKGEGHDNYLNGIIVQFDLTFTIKAWTEGERYHFLDFISSQSTMHRITSFDIKTQCNPYVDDRIIDILRDKVKEYNRIKSLPVSDSLNVEIERHKILEEMYLDIIYNVPVGFRLTARMTTNYRQLKTIYSQRKNHRLPEWKEFCAWIESLPHFKELCLGDSNE